MRSEWAGRCYLRPPPPERPALPPERPVLPVERLTPPPPVRVPEVPVERLMPEVVERVAAPVERELLLVPVLDERDVVVAVERAREVVAVERDVVVAVRVVLPVVRVVLPVVAVDASCFCPTRKLLLRLLPLRARVACVRPAPVRADEPAARLAAMLRPPAGLAAPKPC